MYKPGDFVTISNRRHVVVKRCLRDSYVVKPLNAARRHARDDEPYLIHRLALKPDRPEARKPRRPKGKG